VGTRSDGRAVALQQQGSTYFSMERGMRTNGREEERV
jgi:hypothetical protein